MSVGADDGGSDQLTTHHVMWDEEDSTVLILVRLRHSGGELYGEAYRPGEGWVDSPAAFDVWRNGQDYDLIDADEAADLARRMEAGEV